MLIATDPGRVRREVEELLRPARVPGVVLAASRGSAPPAVLAIGEDAAGVPLHEGSLFPLASVTKLATALAALRLVDEGLLELDAPLARALPGAAAEAATLRSLLSHTAGLPLDLPAERAPYAPGLGWAQLRAACLQASPALTPGAQVQYSNVGYGLAAALVERAAGMPFPDALARLALDPLGVAGWLGAEPPQPPATLADVRGEHAGGPLEPFNSAFWRSLGLPWAGLVADAAGALALARAFLPGGPTTLREETRAEAARSQTGQLGGGFAPPMFWERCPWGLGPELRGDKRPHWAPAGSPLSLGHSGASGCLAWADPATGSAWAILGARAADSGWLLRRGPALSAILLADDASP